MSNLNTIPEPNNPTKKQMQRKYSNQQAQIILKSEDNLNYEEFMDFLFPNDKCFPNSSSSSLTHHPMIWILKILLDGWRKISTPWRKKTNKILFLESAVKNIPHPQKVLTGGEDAYFLGNNCCGVFDGVGGWSSEGIDASLFSSSLMLHVKKFSDSQFRLKQNFDPQTGLEQSYNQVIHQNTPGSSTSLILSLYPEDKSIKASILGDSEFQLIRRREIIYRSPIQQHYFNCPYQLGLTSSTSPKDVLCINLEVQEGDLIISATDGFWDNVFESQILKGIENVLSADNKLCLQYLANYLAEKASLHSRQKFMDTPFSIAARGLGYEYNGGKPDDITVIVSQVRAH